MDFDDYEQLPTANVSTHMMAGAIAGVMEHCVMYPLDSVKTRMQSLTPNAGHIQSIRSVLSRMLWVEGANRMVRGMGPVVCGAGPAHALYFSCYEAAKSTLTQKNTMLNNHIAYFAAGSVATIIHDSVMTPVDVVKQRLQMYNSPYRNMLHAAKNIWRQEGIWAFYRSYTTQLSMNVPFQSIHFVMYEFCQSITNEDRSYNPKAHVISGGIAGGVAAAITTPLDVCKTLLNTQQAARTDGFIEAVQTVYRLGGVQGFFRGMLARVLFVCPSTAICWSTYELFKYLLQHTNEALVEEEILVSNPSAVVKSAVHSAALYSPFQTVSAMHRPKDNPTPAPP
ncbi:mitoferrin-1 [Thrips palmi]|uniref:Mitoferrin-1 n=1 Tax=Thrips palmi TaxID=161013 RepID=A0A6P9AA68_THRPL|nr:mitoferrin-1 [Thrips palmi]